MRVPIIGACCAFPAFTHLGAVAAQPRWTVIGVALVVWAILTQRPSRYGAVLAALLVAALGLGFSELNPAAVIAAPPVLLNLALCALFASTLSRGREPMIGRFARLERGGDLPPDLQSYTRVLTVLWAGFFLLMAAISIFLAARGSVTAWTLFTNVLNYVLVAVFFTLEYAYRRLRYRHYEHASPREVVRQLRRYRVFQGRTDES